MQNSDKYLYTPNNSQNGYNLWMAYPAKEELGLSSLGYMWLSKLADEMPDINLERIYTDTQKTRINFKQVQAISFSMSFDFDFVGVFDILKKYNMPFLSNERGNDFPLIFAGGQVVTTNPDPFEDIFDFFMVGDGEEMFAEVLNVIKLKKTKDEILQELSEISGIYVPKLNKVVTKRTEKLEKVIYTPIISNKSYFKDTFIIEVSRGCMNRCAFCTASYLNLPYRYYEYQKIIDAIDLGLQYTNNIALLGAQISAHPDFDKIMNYIKNKMDLGQNIQLGVSSLRTDAITPELIQILVKGGQKTSTIAIEAASGRLRKLINKNLKEEQILKAVKISRENGLKGLKIYSMIGLPTETQEDIEEFLVLAKKIKTENKGFKLTFSFSTFVPKPQTPFQWEKREDSKILDRKKKYLEKEFAKLGIETKFSSVTWDYWQTVISRGDKNITKALIDIYNIGCKKGDYKKVFKQFNIIKSINGFDFQDKLPWDNLKNTPEKRILINEYNRLLNSAGL